MSEPNIQNKLRRLFAQPLGECARRRVVFWHDVDGSFEELFDQMASDAVHMDAAPSAHPLEFAKVEPGGIFA